MFEEDFNELTEPEYDDLMQQNANSMQYQSNNHFNNQLKKDNNVANNTQMVRNLADIASKTDDPRVKAVGEAIKAADKFTGGKASEMMGRSINRRAKYDPMMRAIQKASNKLANGTGDRISSALNKKNTLAPTPSEMSGKSGAHVANKDNSHFSREEVKEETSDGGGSSFNVSVKFIKTALIAFAPIMAVVIFMNLIVAGSQTYLSVIGLGQADSVSEKDASTAILENGSEGLSDEITDENVNQGSAGNLTGYIYNKDMFVYGTYNLNNISVKKLSEQNFISNIRNREYNEADLEELEDFYSDIGNYDNGNYNMDTVYKFFFKLYYIQKHYKDTYNVDLDIPLIMSILSIQSEDKSKVFSANIKGYKVSTKQDNPLFDYYYNWSNYKMSKDNSAYDIEVLAQNMVSVRTDDPANKCENTPVDGKCYETVSDEEYKEFLKEFLEKKYYLNGNYTLDSDLSTPTVPDNNTTTPDISTPETPTSPDSATPAVGDFRQWTQCNQSWSDYIVPTSNETMCQIGCLITSITMQIARSGTLVVSPTLDPGVTLDYFNFASGGNLYWYTVSNLAPNFQYYTAITVTGMSKESIAKKISSYDSSKYYMVLAVGKLHTDYIHHYVALDYVDLSNNNIYIMDPASISITSLYDYYKLYTIHIYEKRD